MIIPCIRLLRGLAHDLPMGYEHPEPPHETKAVRLALAMGEVVQRAGSAFFRTFRKITSDLARNLVG